MIRRVSNAAIVQSLLDQTFLYQTDDDRFIDRGFIDYDVQPYPAVSPQKLFAFHRLLGQSFSVAHRSVETEDGHVVTRVVLKPKPKPTKTDNPAKPGEPQNSSTPAAPDAWPCLRAIWFWEFAEGMIVSRSIYPRPADEHAQAYGLILKIVRTLKALRPGIIFVALFWIAALLEPTQEIWRLAAGAPGNKIDYSWLLDISVVGPVFGLIVALQSVVSIALLAKHPVFPARLKGRRLWFPPVSGWQYAMALILAGLAQCAIALPLQHAAGVVTDVTIHNHMLFHAGFEAFFALGYFIVAVLIAFDGVIPHPDAGLLKAGLFALIVFSLINLVVFWLASGGYSAGPIKFVVWGSTLLGAVSGASLVGDKFGIPIVSLFVALLLINAIMGWDDHHDIYTSSRSAHAPPMQNLAPPLVGEFFEQWMASPFRHPVLGREPPGKYPVFVVAAEGGGIRAAILTAMVLDELRARPHFNDHLFALVGVSGGSLGVSAYAEAQRQRLWPPTRLSDMAKLGLTYGWQSSLHHDLLSPIIGSMLGTDFLSRFVPRWLVNLSDVDRARALERAWEEKWRAATDRDLDEVWFSMMRPSPNDVQPGLVLMTTNTTTGEPMAVSHFRFQRRAADKQTGCPEDIPLDTLWDEAPGIDVPLSTAAFMSARFPIFSPAARVETSQGAKHFVDGGYYDNSGVLAALDIYRGIRCKAGSAKIVVIRIENSEVDAPDSSHEPRPSLFDLVGPVSALYHTRGSHGREAIRELEAEIASAKSCQNGQTCPDFEDVLFKLAPPTDNVPVTLSWFITAAARKEIAEQLLQPFNQASFARIDALLTVRPAK